MATEIQHSLQQTAQSTDADDGEDNKTLVDKASGRKSALNFKASDASSA
jgi:hypothetical protein